MNRKLVNAMLLVALATGSCSMFTSCKDTDDDFYSRVISNEAQLEKDLAKAKEDIANLKTKFDDYYTKQEVDGKVTGYCLFNNSVCLWFWDCSFSPNYFYLHYLC